MVRQKSSVNYEQLSRVLRKGRVSVDTEALRVPGLDLEIYKLLFESKNSRHLVGAASYRCEEHGLSFEDESRGGTADEAIQENNRFRYPLIREQAKGPLQRHDRVLILLHGLNEGTFSKYVPWAYRIWEQTQTPVLLFPLTFHMNRVLPGWMPQQQEISEQRRALSGNDSSHRYNAVMSERLDTRPERFFWGAIQTYLDLVDLVREIRAGRHPHFAPDARVDLLGYSAGGYFTLFLMMDDHEDLFTESRGIVFASGIPIRDLDLASPLILDLTAEVALMKLFVKNFDPPQSARIQHWIESHSEGRWMRAFCGQRPQRELLEKRFRELAPRLLGIADTNDEVVPIGAMLNTLQGVKRNTGVRIVELELGVHENPFSASSYEKDRPGRKLITEFLDEQIYGEAFDTFVETIVHHLSA